ncbi:MAG TPA: DNA-formamidopyrimidine glycosylase family protein [Thermoanaerobaculia bacterium]
MPEGDTILRSARTLNAALAGRVVRRFETVLPKLARVDDQNKIAGRTVEQVVAAGKHLIVNFSGGLHLRTHMRMNGSWHIYRPGERWKRRRDEMRIVIETDDYVAVGFNIPVAELLDDRALTRQPDLRAIGPDILGDTFDEAEAFRRIRERPDAEIADVLLNQRVIAGIGNIWKSETLFACRVNPFVRVGALTDAQIDCLLKNARKLMTHSANATSPNDLSVYSRGGKPCRRCRTAIESRKQGLDARLTYWCPKCQAAG